MITKEIRECSIELPFDRFQTNDGKATNETQSMDDRLELLNRLVGSLESLHDVRIDQQLRNAATRETSAQH